MEKFIEQRNKKLEQCSNWPEVLTVFEETLSKEYIPTLFEILKEFLINDPEVENMIKQNLDQFLEQIKEVCDHVISNFFNYVIKKTGKTEFFTIHVKWFYLLFVYFTLKKMVNEQIIDWPNFKVNQNIQKIFIDNFMKYERELPHTFYMKGLLPNFRIMMIYITSSPSSILEGIGGVPDYMSDYPY